MNGRAADASRFKSVVFDFDYTLADSSPGVIECINYALQKMGLSPCSHDAIRAMIGISLAQTSRELSGDGGGQRFAEFERHFIERGDQVMLQGIRLFDSVRPTVEALLVEGITLGIVSTKYRCRIEAVLKRNGLEGAFAVVFGGEDVTAHKPDPSGLTTAVAKLGRADDEVLYVGDSTVDAETAQRAGVSFVAVLSGVTPREAFEGYETHAIIDDLASLPRLVL
jgi:phosphoglycolate phosphatase